VLAETTQLLPLGKIPVNWFDAVFVLMLVAGFFRGRKNGMSMEILPLCQWLSVVIVSALFYPFVARLLVSVGGLNLLTAYISGYIVLTLVVLFVFSLLKRILTPRLSGSTLFGNAEYYFGMLAGMIRFTCILLFALAFLHARSFTTGEINADKDYQQRWFGGGLYSGNYFPTVNTVQREVFENSFTGRYIQKYFGGLLIKSTVLHDSQPEQGPAPAH
jgi:uncharacterized membrane protein required for colicin V production